MKNEDPLDRLINMCRPDPDPGPGDPPPFLHTRVMASVRAAEAGAPRRQWAAWSLGSLPVAAAVTVLCAWQRPPAAHEEAAVPPDDSASAIAAALIDSTIPQP